MRILTLVQLGFWLSSHQNLSYSNCPYILGHSFRNQGFLGSMWLSKSGLHVFGLIAEGLGEGINSFKVWSGKWDSKPFLLSQTSNEMEASSTFGVEDLCVLAKPTSSTSSSNELNHVPRLLLNWMTCHSLSMFYGIWSGYASLLSFYFLYRGPFQLGSQAGCPWRSNPDAFSYMQV